MVAESVLEVGAQSLGSIPLLLAFTPDIRKVEIVGAANISYSAIPLLLAILIRTERSTRHYL